MAYLTDSELQALGLKYLGKDVKISDKAAIYNCDQIEIGNHSRIDDFCVISGKIKIGNYCHITPMCLLAGGEPGLELMDFVTLAYGVKIFTQSDDYSGETMTNSLIPTQFKNEFKAPVCLQEYVIVGANSTIMPGTVLATGCSFGAMSLVLRNTDPWGIYVGIPVKRIRDRSKNLLKLSTIFLSEQ